MTPLDRAKEANATYEDAGYNPKRWISIHRDTDTVCFVAWREEEQAVSLSIRGTVSLRNWLVNFKFLFPKKGMHRGVSKAVYYHLSSVQGYLLKMKPKVVYIDGHSMGGGCSTGLGWLLHLQSYNVSVNTYGGMKCFTRRKAKEVDAAFGNRVVRYIHNNDIVPRLLGVFYSHVGQAVHFSSKGELMDGPSRWERFKDRLRGRSRNLLFDGIADHDMDDYVALIEENAI